MLRPFLVTAVIAAMVSPALITATASADSCMCQQASVGPMGMREELPGANPRVLQSAEVGPFFSSDGASLTSEEPRLARARLAHHSEVQWCVSADDPRCSPRDSLPGHGAGVVEGAHVASGGVTTPRLEEPPPSETTLRDTIDGARAGVRHRLDRPPRG